MNKSKLCLLAVIACLAPQAFAADDHGGSVTPVPYKPGITMTKSVQAGITPDKAIAILQAGNERFQAGKPLKRDLKMLVRKIAPGQYPFASIVACTDSRSAPEIVFDQSIGDIFVTRVAGNIVNDDMIGSLEYAAKVLGTRVIVVLGHNNCGAINGACDGLQMGNLTGLLSKIQPAVNAAKTPGVRNSKNHEFVEEVAEINVSDVIKTIHEKSPILKELEAEEKIKIVGAFYDTDNGQVRWQ
jgi:carbonic anhydrase